MSAGAIARGKLEIVREMLEAFGRRDLEAVLALCDPEAQFEVEEMPELERFSGYEGMREFLMLNWEPFDSFASEIDRLIEVEPDRVVMLNRIRATGRGSGIEVEQERGGVLTVRDGLVVGGQFFTSQAKALEAAGLS